MEESDQCLFLIYYRHKALSCASVTLKPCQRAKSFMTGTQTELDCVSFCVYSAFNSMIRWHFSPDFFLDENAKGTDLITRTSGRCWPRWAQGWDYPSVEAG